MRLNSELSYIKGVLRTGNRIPVVTQLHARYKFAVRYGYQITGSHKNWTSLWTLDWTGSECGTSFGFCEHDDQSVGSIREEAFLTVQGKPLSRWVSFLVSEKEITFRPTLITRTTLMHFTITFTLLKLKASTCFGHHLPILRRHYTNTVLVGVACCK
jgi:hypothetical protein